MLRSKLLFTTLQMLRDCIGKEFISYKCDPFVYSPSVFGIVGLNVDGTFYRLAADLQETTRFFSKDDVATLTFTSSSEEGITSLRDDGKMIVNPVHDFIESIDIIVDKETVTHNNDVRSLVSTKGLIFHLKTGNEISFEIGTWFSEFITIRKGYNLINEFSSIEEFIEEWDESSGYKGSIVRNVITL